MNKYTIEFIGRLAGALGVTYKIIEDVEADSVEAARVKLYDKYEHIYVTKIITDNRS